MRVLFVLVVASSLETLTTGGMVFASSPVFKERCDLETKTHKGRATIAISSREVRAGDSMTVEVRFENHGCQQQFFNPFFQSLIPMPARLAVFDSERRYVGDLLWFSGGSQRSLSREDWVTIPHRGSIGCVVVVRFVDASKYPLSGLRKMSSGRYCLQMIFHSRFASEPKWKRMTVPDAARLNLPMLSDDQFEELRTRLAWFPSQQFDLAAWSDRYKDDDLFRSNVIEIRFTDEKTD
jgi:hypothetical protein